MGSRFPSHQLSNGLYVSGRPEQPKERTPTVSSVSMPYTGGDVKRSGELGKMVDILVENSKSRKSGPIANAPTRTGSFGGAASHSGPITSSPAGRLNYSTSGPISSTTGGVNRQKSSSGPLNKHGEPIKKSSGPQSGGVTPVARQNSGPLAPVLPTGLITSGPLNSSMPPRKVSGLLKSTGSTKSHSTSVAHNQAITKLSLENNSSFRRSLPKSILCWNTCWGRRAVTNFVSHYPDAELRTAKNGQYVKVSGVVTCGNVPLESSFQKIPRCVYTSASLYEYRSWNSKPANATHRRFTWGLRSVERNVVDFYISDFQSGLRALVKTGFGAKVTAYVDESIVSDINSKNKDLSPEFVRWLEERNLSSDDRIMRMKEGYIKEGSTVSVMGVVQRNENVLMIIPPSEPFSTGCQWAKCILPVSLEGIVLRSEDTSNMDVIPV